MAPLNDSNSSQMVVNSDENDNEIVEGDRKWQSPASSKNLSAQSPTMPRRSDHTLDFGAAVVATPTKTASDNSHSRSHSLSPRSMLDRKVNKATNPGVDVSVTSFTALVDAVTSPPPRMPHRRASTYGEDGTPVVAEAEAVKAWQSNHTDGGKQEEFFAGLNDANGPKEKKKMRRVRRNGGIQRAFSDSELSEASTINSQKESKKDRKQNILQRRKERLARKFLGRGKAANVPDTVNDEDEDVVDTDKDLEGFTGITLKKKSAHSTTDKDSRHNASGTDDIAPAKLKKTQSEIDLETKSRVSKSPIRFPGRDRSNSRGRARSSSRRGRASGSSVATGATDKSSKKKSSSVSRTKRLSNRKKNSNDDSASSSEGECEKPRRPTSKSRGSKSPRRRRKSAGARKPKKGGRKPMPPAQIPLNDDGSQRTMTDLVIDVPPTQDFVSPCTIGSGRRSVMDLLTPSNRSRSSKVSAITMSTGMFSPFTAVSSQGFNDDFSDHSAFTKSSLRGPQHIPDLEASEHQASSSTLVNGHRSSGYLSAVLENSSKNDGLGFSGRSLATGEGGDELGGAPRTPRSSLQMPAVPRRRPSSDDHSLSSALANKGPLFDSSPSGKDDEDEPFDRFAAVTKQRSTSDLIGEDRPTNMLRKASSERNILGSPIRNGGTRIWRRGKRKPQKPES